jgi:hypothetical protein
VPHCGRASPEQCPRRAGRSFVRFGAASTIPTIAVMTPTHDADPSVHVREQFRPKHGRIPPRARTYCGVHHASTAQEPAGSSPVFGSDLTGVSCLTGRHSGILTIAGDVAGL